MKDSPKICKKCNGEFIPKKGLLNYCSLTCRNSRKFDTKHKENIKKGFDKFKQDPIRYNKWLKSLMDNHSSKSPDSIKKRKEKFMKNLMSKDFVNLSWDLKRKRVIHEQDYKCKTCKLSEWIGQKISFEIDHINGIRNDNSRENLQALCPNCHSLTPTWRGRTKEKKITNTMYSKSDVIVDLYNKKYNIRQILITIGFAPKGRNYQTLKRILKENGILVDS